MALRVLLISLLLVGASANAVAAQIPPEVDGAVVHIPVVEGAISVDGSLGDWANIEPTVTSTGPVPSLDPATRGELSWRLAADATALYFAATITDDQIVAGQNDERYWNEDSIELYLNLSGDLATTTYIDGVGQLTFAAVDIGTTDPAGLTLTGSRAADFSVRGVVFETVDGWGVEAAIDLDGRITPNRGPTIGVQVQANGSSGADRDMKLSWSTADLDDTSYLDPSVFGAGIVLGPGVDGLALPSEETPNDDGDAAVVSIDEAAPADDVETDSVAQPEISDVLPEDNEGRSILVAAIVAAVTILVGGLWFEHRRKKSEARLAIEATPSTTEAEPTDEEVDEMINNILND